MTINHLNLIVAHVDNAARFFETYFDFEPVLVKGGHAVAVLKNKKNFTLVLMADKAGNNIYPENFHIGFMFDTAAAVEKIHEQLKAGNIAVDREPQKIRNSYGFYFHFDNILIEVGTN